MWSSMSIFKVPHATALLQFHLSRFAGSFSSLSGKTEDVIQLVLKITTYIQLQSNKTESMSGQI